jgi:hypothetical protein
MPKRFAARDTAFALAVLALGVFFLSNAVEHSGHGHTGGGDCAVCHLGKLPALAAARAPASAPTGLDVGEPQVREQSGGCTGLWLASPSRAPPLVLPLA